jgi:hypothetical protein
MFSKYVACDLAYIIGQMSFEVLTVVKMLTLVSWVLMPCGLVDVSIAMRAVAHKATHAPRQFSDLLYVTNCFIPPVVPYLCQDTISYITESHHSRLVP